MTKKQKNNFFQKIKNEVYSFLKENKKELKIIKIERPANKYSFSKYINIKLENKDWLEIRISDHSRSFKNDPDFELIINNNFGFELNNCFQNEWILEQKIENFIEKIENEIKEKINCEDFYEK